MISTLIFHWLYFLFPQYGNKNCTEGYSSYLINIWGLREPAKNKAQNKSLTNQQITNLLHHLKTCHGVSREEVNSSHLPVETPSFSWYIDSFHCSGNGMYMEESFVADRYQYIEGYLGTIADTLQNIRGLLNVEIYCTS